MIRGSTHFIPVPCSHLQDVAGFRVAKLHRCYLLRGLADNGLVEEDESEESAESTSLEAEVEE